ncbi:MAG: hypothetical protein A2073_04735 [Deltaproteobacteria bacterium GWC2_42_11]|nr:MAG: hypothetical protein A2073_04735 [Deltaproteobacteria bacterium GWC2_42_11]HBO85271.1 hypothetical protein [Deltaproteobacteria bacterium]
MALINTPEAAMRLARTIIYDILLYNKDKVKEGIKNDNIFELLEKELKEGFDLYTSRTDPEFAKKTNFYNNAVVDILIKKSGNIESDIW